MVSLLKDANGAISILSHTNGNGSLKRGASDIANGAAPTPSKRVRIVDPAGTTALDIHLSEGMMRKYVIGALDEQKSNKQSQRFEELRKKFTMSPSDDFAPSSKELREILSALTYVVAQLNQQCSGIVHDIVSFNWAGRDERFYAAYMGFLMNVVSAHSNYVFTVMRMLVKHLTLQPREIGRIPGDVPVTRKEIFNRAHRALRSLLDMVPTAYSALFQAIQSEFPHKDQKRIYQTTFMTNLLRILDYAPVSRTKIMGLIFEKVMQVDVEIQVNFDDLEEEEGETLARELNGNGNGEVDMVERAKSRMAAELEDDDADESDDDAESDDGGEDSVKKIKETVEKLDAMLEVLFTYFSSLFPDEPIAEPSQASFETFELLLHFFDVTVLPTFRSRYIQFVVFWSSQKSPRLSDYFLGMLLSQALDMSKSQVTRQAASAYTASYVARAKTLSRQTIRDTVTYLCSWLDRFVTDREKECSGADVSRFGSFYAITQAVMYIFCFRWKELKGEKFSENEDEDVMLVKGWAPGLNVLERLITSKFNPLKVCSAVVVNQFARLAHHFDFVYCYSIIERNKRADFHTSSSSSANGGVQVGGDKAANETSQLQTFFPFDPYKLSLSRGWIDNIYVEWQGVKGLDDEDEEDDEDDEDDENDEADDDSGSEDGDEEIDDAEEDEDK